jgi:hypothetical protein
MILLQIHHMWYETNMIQECWDSILAAKKSAPNVDVKVSICLNKQTYVEKPSEGMVPDEFFTRHLNHPLFKDPTTEVITKTDNEPFYNIADWRREKYDPEARYTVWGESDTIVPRDFFAILDQIEIKQPHVVTFAGRPMWDNSWDIITHERLQGYSKPCQCGDTHREDCIELLEEPLKYKDYITQKELDRFNSESGDIKIKQVSWKIDGSLVCISGNMPTPFIAPGMHFVREDTCFEYFLRKKNITQVCVTTRLKGHNYKHPNKRTGTFSTRNDEVFKKYADQSISSMNKFISNL